MARRAMAAGQLWLCFTADPPASAPLPAIDAGMIVPPMAVPAPVAPPLAVAPPVAPPPPPKRGRGRPRREESSPLAPPTPRAKAEASLLRSRIILALASRPDVAPLLSGISHALDADEAEVRRVVARLEHLNEVETWPDEFGDTRIMMAAATVKRFGLTLSRDGRRWEGRSLRVG
jgi:hypothetical protein